jgi:aspartyl-tRNA(Asn)/glutamyl-tRNA(Gln) amidotransferase subunit A
MALAGLGTDTSGSIRLPAALCGLVGIRLTVGRVPREGVVPLAWSYHTVGPLCRSVEDAALLMEVLTGERLGSATGQWRLGVVEELFEIAEGYGADGVLEADGEVAELVPMRFERLRYAGAVHQLVQYAEAAQIHAPWLDQDYAPEVGTRLDAGRLLRAALQACVVPPSELGSPVASVPVGSHDGPPYGMQIIGRPEAEALVLAIAARMERR